MNEQDLAKLGYVKQDDGSYKRVPVLVARVSAAVPESRPLQTLASRQKDEGRGSGRVAVTITVASCRLRDPDNTVVKWLVDAIRRDGYIQDDTEADILLNVRQVKVAKREQQGTLVEIMPI